MPVRPFSKRLLSASQPPLHQVCEGEYTGTLTLSQPENVQNVKKNHFPDKNRQKVRLFTLKKEKAVQIALDTME